MRQVSSKRLGYIITIALISAMLIQPATPRPTDGGAHSSSTNAAPSLTRFASLPLSFEPNVGQFDPQVRYLARGGGYTLFLTANEAVVSLASRQPGREKSRPYMGDPVGAQFIAPSDAANAAPPTVLRYSLRGANPAPQMVAQSELPGKSNYFLGNNPASWRTNVPNYARVAYQSVYPGIDMAWYGNSGSMEYDFSIAAGADPSVIRLAVAGADKVTLEAGSLVLHTTAGDLRQPAPRIYQDGPNGRHEVAGGYVLEADGSVGFALAAYDRSQAVVIDPQLVYSTYLGGNGTDVAWVGLDGGGNIYAAGHADSTDFPTQNPIQRNYGGGGTYPGDCFVAKLNSSGSVLIYSTYLGGSDRDECQALTVSASGEAYVTGVTQSNNFPVANALQPKIGGAANAFVAKIDSSGSSLNFSTYLGGSESDGGHGIAIGSDGNVYLTGETTSNNFPVVNALQRDNKGGFGDGFITEMKGDGSSIIYSSYFGGPGQEKAFGIALGPDGDAYITGFSSSPHLGTPNSFQPTRKGGLDAFVARFRLTSPSLMYATYVGGSKDEWPWGIAVDSSGSAYITGKTDSTDFPVANPIQPSKADGQDAFITKINPSGSALVYSTYLGGDSGEEGWSIKVDSGGNAYIAGFTASSNFPVANAIQHDRSGIVDAFVTKLNSSGSAFVFSTYLGGSGEDKSFSLALGNNGDIYVSGGTYSTDFPTASPLQQSNGGGRYDAFIARISESAPPPTPTVIPTPTAVPLPTQVASTDHPYVFPQTGKTIGGKFRSYWEKNGGLAQQGFPISNQFQEVSDLDGKTYTVQYFERAVFELHPENQPPYDVLLSQLGTFRYKQKYPNGAPNQQVSTDHPYNFAQTGHTIGGKFRTYWEQHGGLAQQGYPISDVFQEISDLDGKTYTVQYFERAVFELHPENQPPYDVLLSQLGTFRYHAKYPGAP